MPESQRCGPWFGQVTSHDVLQAPVSSGNGQQTSTSQKGCKYVYMQGIFEGYMLLDTGLLEDRGSVHYPMLAITDAHAVRPSMIAYLVSAFSASRLKSTYARPPKAGNKDPVKGRQCQVPKFGTQTLCCRQFPCMAIHYPPP